jgi:hypothetical protein
MAEPRATQNDLEDVNSTVPGTRPDIMVHMTDAPEEIRSLLHDELYPDDAYDDGVYWTDLPVTKRTDKRLHESWVLCGHLSSTILLNQSAPIFHNYVVTGLGFFTEGYTFFSVGNILVLFESVWSSCFKTYKVCNKTWVETINYLEIVGIMFGQIAVDIIGDWIGRRWGLIQDAMIMFLGIVMLTAMWGRTLNGWVICYTFSLWLFGVGMGGQYPMTSITAMEGVHGQSTTRSDKLHRGRSVALAFLMQVGIYYTTFATTCMC